MFGETFKIWNKKNKNNVVAKDAKLPGIFLIFPIPHFKKGFNYLEELKKILPANKNKAIKYLEENNLGYLYSDKKIKKTLEVRY